MRIEKRVAHPVSPKRWFLRVGIAAVLILPPAVSAEENTKRVVE